MKEKKMNAKNTTARRSIILAIAALFSFVAHAVDSFDPTSNLLTMDSVTTGGATYRNVAVTVSSYDLIGVAGGSPVADTFDSASNILLLGAVAFQGAIYNNVSIKINSYALRSIGGSQTPGTLPTSTYTGEMAGYLAALNNYRTQCGIPALSQNTLLDSAAQSVGMGSTQFALAAAAGYAFPLTTGGINSDYSSNSTNKELVGKYELQTAMMSPGAMLNMMRPYTEIGLVGNLGKAGGVNQRGAQVLFGNPVSRNLSGPVTFPCSNTTDAPPYTSTFTGAVYYASTPATAQFNYYLESPNGTQGTPIGVFANVGDSLVLTNAAVTARGGAVVPVVLKSADRTLSSYEGYVWPQQNLLPNQVYDVIIFGTVNGVAFSKSFPFRTGAAIPLFLP